MGLYIVGGQLEGYTGSPYFPLPHRLFLENDTLSIFRLGGSQVLHHRLQPATADCNGLQWMRGGQGGSDSLHRDFTFSMTLTGCQINYPTTGAPVLLYRKSMNGFDLRQ